MQCSTRNATPTALVALFATVLLGGCASATFADRDPADEGSASTQPPCIVGTWNLDVPDYEIQSAEFIHGLNLPIEDFSMDGAGTIQFTEDGLVSTDVGLTMTGIIVAGDTRTPFNTPSAYTASGDWSMGDDAASIDLANWANVPDPSITGDPAAPPIPAIDYTNIPTVSATCTETALVLQGPDAPLSARWTR